MKTRLFLALFSVLILIPISVMAFSVPSGLTVQETLIPGQRVEGVITLQGGEDFETVRLYQTDYLFYADGSNLYGEPGSTARSNAPWISIYPKEVTIPPGTSVQVHYQIVVPDTELAGTYWSMVMAEPYVPPVEAPPEEESKVTLGIRTVLRYGIQIVTHIGDSGKRELKIVRRQLSQDGQDLVLSLDIENTGERWLIPALRAEIYDEAGTLVGKKEGDKYRIYPGTSVQGKVKLGSLPKGKYKVLVILDNGDQYVWGAQYAVNIQ